MKLYRTKDHGLSHQIADWRNKFKRTSYVGKERSLNGKMPRKLLGTPEDPWKGSAKAGKVILKHYFTVYKQLLLNPQSHDYTWDAKQIWISEDINDRWLEYLHSFNWLRDLSAAIDQKAALVRAQNLVVGWIEAHDEWHKLSWRADITGRRIVNWLAYAHLVLDTDDLFFRGNILRLLGRQTRHLVRSAKNFPEGGDKILAIVGLVQAGLFLPNDEGWLEKGISFLEAELPKEILKDGGIISRNPAEHHCLLRDLLMLRNGFSLQSKEIPKILDEAISRMVSFMLCLTHADGKLALFNGAYEEDILPTLKMAGENFKMMKDAEETGFRRLECDKTILIMDVSPPAPLNLSAKSHAGTLSFELSRGQSRMIVNCGSAAYLPNLQGIFDCHNEDQEMVKDEQEDRDIYWMCRSTAAHSTAIISNRNSSEIRDDGLIGHSPDFVKSTKTFKQDIYNITGHHDGYRRAFSLDHIRSISVTRDGTEIRGKDRFKSIKLQVKNPPDFDIRFHLHPSVKAELNKEGTEVILTLESGEKWEFTSGGAALKLSDSLYLGAVENFQATQQIILTGYIDKKLREVEWEFRLVKE